MLQLTSTRLAAVLCASGAVVLLGTAIPDMHAAPVTSTVELNACTATVKDPVAVAAAPVTIVAALSETIGDSLSASFPTESSVEVVKLAPAGAPAAGDASHSIELTLNTSKAKPGEWPLSLKGTRGECSGKIKVKPGA